MVKLVEKKLRDIVSIMEELSLLLNSDDEVSVYDPAVILRAYTSGDESVATTDIWLSIELEPAFGDAGVPLEVIDRIREVVKKYDLNPIAINVTEYGLVEIVLAYEATGRGLRGEGEVETWEGSRG